MKAPDGSTITGTDELIPGEALGDFQDGTFDYNGNGTEVCWDGQTTITIAGQTVYVDEDGGRWLESQLVPLDAEELPASAIHPWHWDENLVEIEIKLTLQSLIERIGGKRGADIPDHLVSDIISVKEQFE